MFKILGTMSIVVLTWAAACEASAQTYLPDEKVCRRALNSDRTGWIEGSAYTDEVNRRGLTLEVCRQIASAPLPTYNKAARGTRDIIAIILCRRSIKREFSYLDRCDLLEHNPNYVFDSAEQCQNALALRNLKTRQRLWEGFEYTIDCMKKTEPIWEPVD